eukprot:scaffold1525_cov142-Cylindrotheca_fusiformis.AAC.40
MLTYVEQENNNGRHIDCISWARDGHTFIIRDRKELVDFLMPLFFRGGKFSSFTRKLYRWGFRQICVPKGGDKKNREMVFGHEHFQRDNKALMSDMRSVTAAGTRRAIAALTSRKKAREKSNESQVSKEASSLEKTSSYHGSVTIKSPPLLPTDKSEQVNYTQSDRQQMSATRGAPSLTATAEPSSTLEELIKSRSITMMCPPGQSTLSSQQSQTSTATPSSGSALTDLFKSKSHSLMTPPSQTNLLTLKNPSVLQEQMDRLRAMASRVSSTNNMTSSTFSFNKDGGSFANRQHMASTNSQISSQALAAARKLVYPDAPFHRTLSSQKRPSITPSEFLRNAQLSKRQNMASPHNFAQQRPSALPNLVLPESLLKKMGANDNYTSQAHAAGLLHQMAHSQKKGSSQGGTNTPSLILDDSSFSGR